MGAGVGPAGGEDAWCVGHVTVLATNGCLAPLSVCMSSAIQRVCRRPCISVRFRLGVFVFELQPGDLHGAVAVLVDLVADGVGVHASLQHAVGCAPLFVV